MFESIIKFFKKIGKQDKEQVKSKDTAKERLHLVLMQDRANVSADFLDLMKQEIIEVIKKYIDVDENAIDVRLTNKAGADETSGAPALYANIPIVSIKEEVKSKMARQNKKEEGKTISSDKQVKEVEDENNTEKINEKDVQKTTDLEKNETEKLENKEVSIENKEIKQEYESKEAVIKGETMTQEEIKENLQNTNNIEEAKVDMQN